MKNPKYRVWCEDYQEWEKDLTVLLQEGIVGQVINGQIKIIRPERHIVEFYTGLNDKNGREIYEGDIVIYSGSNDLMYRLPAPISIGEYFTHAKEFKHFGVRAKRIDMKNQYFGLANDYCDFKIIGNIHENKDLLK